jgi:hypothetical protein
LGRLKTSFNEYESNVFIGKVRYIDYQSTDFSNFIDENNPINRFLHKRKSFEHERELRAVVSSSDLHSGGKYVLGMG